MIVVPVLKDDGPAQSDVHVDGILGGKKPRKKKKDENQPDTSVPILKVAHDVSGEPRVEGGPGGGEWTAGGGATLSAPKISEERRKQLYEAGKRALTSPHEQGSSTSDPVVQTKITINESLVGDVSAHTVGNKKFDKWVESKTTEYFQEPQPSRDTVKEFWTDAVGHDKDAEEADFQKRRAAWEKKVTPVVAKINEVTGRNAGWKKVSDLKVGDKFYLDSQPDSDPKTILNIRTEHEYSGEKRVLYYDVGRTKERPQDFVPIKPKMPLTSMPLTLDKAATAFRVLKRETQVWIDTKSVPSMMSHMSPLAIKLKEVLGFPYDGEIDGAELWSKFRALPDFPTEPRHGDNPIPLRPMPKDDGEAVRQIVIARTVRDYIDTWAGSSGDSTIKSLALQQAVAKNFKIPDQYIKPVRDYASAAEYGTDDNAWKRGQQQYAKDKPFLDQFVNDVYNNTQETLKKNKVSEMLLWRGMHVDDMANPHRWLVPPVARVEYLGQRYETERYLVNFDETPQERKLTLQPASSWSVDKSVAVRFTGDDTTPDLMLQAVVPAARIWSLASASGPGCLNEREAVVLGGSGTARVEWGKWNYDGEGQVAIRPEAEAWGVTKKQMAAAKKEYEKHDEAFSSVTPTSLLDQTTTSTPLHEIKAAQFIDANGGYHPLSMNKLKTEDVESYFFNHPAKNFDDVNFEMISTWKQNGYLDSPPPPQVQAPDLKPGDIFSMTSPTSQKYTVKEIKPDASINGQSIKMTDGSSTFLYDNDMVYHHGYEAPPPPKTPEQWAKDWQAHYKDEPAHNYVMAWLMKPSFIDEAKKYYAAHPDKKTGDISPASVHDWNVQQKGQAKKPTIFEHKLLKHTGGHVAEVMPIDTWPHCDWIKHGSPDVSMDGTVISGKVRQQRLMKQLVPVMKGDIPDHPFHGNQWVTGASGPEVFDPQIQQSARGFKVEGHNLRGEKEMTNTRVTRSELNKHLSTLGQQMSTAFGGSRPSFKYYITGQDYFDGLAQAAHDAGEPFNTEGGVPDARAVGTTVHLAPWVTSKLTEVDPDGNPMNPQEWRKVAHEIAHTQSGNSTGKVKYNSGLNPTVEEGGAEVLSLAWALSHFGPRMTDTKWTTTYTGKNEETVSGPEAFLRNHVYSERTAEVLAQAIRRNGWDRDAVLNDIHRVFTGTSDDRSKFFQDENGKTLRYWADDASKGHKGGDERWQQLMATAPPDVKKMTFQKTDDPLFDKSRERAGTLMNWLLGKASGQPATGSKPITPITPDEARGNSRPVSATEFTHLADQGSARLADYEHNASPPTGLDQHWDDIVNNAYTESQKSWGGVTVDSHTGAPYPGDKGFALTVKSPGQQSVTIPENADQPHFAAAMKEARQRFDPQLQRPDHHLGVFHDDDTHQIDIDPVLVVQTPQEVEEIGAATHAIGGAYDFSTGDGYFPPHVSEQDRVTVAKMAKRKTHAQFHAESRDANRPVWQPRPESKFAGPVEVLKIAHDVSGEARDGHGEWTSGGDTPPKKLYHVTTKTAVPSIEKRGLDNTLSTEELWSNVDDWDDGVYLWDNLDKAKEYAQSMIGDNREPVIYEVNAQGLSPSPDTTGSQPVKGGWYLPSVSPDRLRRLDLKKSLLILKVAHDVSGEARDDHGKWTAQAEAQGLHGEIHKKGNKVWAVLHDKPGVTGGPHALAHHWIETRQSFSKVPTRVARSLFTDETKVGETGQNLPDEQVSSGRYLYHQTPRDHRESIQATGLDVERSGGVYLAREPAPDRHNGVVVDTWRVDTKGLNVQPDPEWPEGWAVLRESIPPDRLTLVRTTGEHLPSGQVKKSILPPMLKVAGGPQWEDENRDHGEFSDTAGSGAATPAFHEPIGGRISVPHSDTKPAERQREANGPDAPQRVSLDMVQEVGANKNQHPLADTIRRQSAVPGFEDFAGRTDRAALTEIAQRQAENVMDLVDQSFQLSRSGTMAHASWYPFAHNLGEDWAKDSGYHPDAMYATMAVLSPGADWAHNVAWAKHFIDTVKNEDKITTDQKIIDTIDKTRMASYLAAKATGANSKKPEQSSIKAGATLASLSDRDAAEYIRAMADIKGGLQTILLPGMTETEKALPNKYLFMQKAVSVLRNPSRATIDKALGGDMKVRSFYNNLRDPLDLTYEDVTSDTHHFGAVNGLPLGMGHHFIASGNASLTAGPTSGKTGVTGTYPLALEATRLATHGWDDKDGVHHQGTNEKYNLDLHPNQVQSIAWEMHRQLYPKTIRREKLGFIDAVGKLRSAYRKGEVTHDYMLKQVEAERDAIRQDQLKRNKKTLVPSLDELKQRWDTDGAAFKSYWTKRGEKVDW